VPVQRVPIGAEPGVLTSATMIAGPAICDLGSRQGARDGSVSGWIEVAIVPIGTVTPDAWGRLMHVVLKFTQPENWNGKRRRSVPNWSPYEDPGAMLVECDPGTFWIGTQCTIMFTGGTTGDLYDITITESTSQQQADSRPYSRTTTEAPYQVDVFEPNCKFKLTAFGVGDAGSPPPGIPFHHRKFRLIAGTATYGGAAIAPGTKWLPLNAPIALGSGCLYQTGGGV
jgi:hypothetical protein